MKKSLLKLAFLLLAVPIVFIGCKKTDVIDESNSVNNITKDAIVYCGTPVVKNLYEYGTNTTVYGTVTVGNDANNLYVTLTLASNWVFWNDGFETWEKGTHLFVGTEQQLLATNPYTVVNHDADKTGYFMMYDFPYHADVSALGTNTYMFTVPRSLILDDQGAPLKCPMLVVGASIKNLMTEELKLVSAKENTKHPAYWFTYCMQDCTLPSCQTAYAFGGINPGGALVTKCFIDIPNIASNNWGWTNKIGAGIYDWPIYAGAGQCDITKGTLVGNLHVVYNPPSATITYEMLPGFTLKLTHLYVGKDPNLLPKNKFGQFITAPGQFPYTGNPVTVNNLSGYIWIAAHSEVCW